MQITTEHALQRGLSAQKQGKLEEAERFFRAILRHQPQNTDANYYLGILAFLLGKPT